VSEMIMLVGLGLVAAFVHSTGRRILTGLDRVEKVAVLASERSIEAFNVSRYPNLYNEGWRNALRREYLLEEKIDGLWAAGVDGGRYGHHPPWSIRLKQWAENSKETESLGRLCTWLSQYEVLAEEGDLSLAEARFLWHDALAESDLMEKESLNDDDPSVRKALDALEDSLREAQGRWRRSGRSTKTIRNARFV